MTADETIRRELWLRLRFARLAYEVAAERERRARSGDGTKPRRRKQIRTTFNEADRDLSAAIEELCE